MEELSNITNILSFFNPLLTFFLLIAGLSFMFYLKNKIENISQDIHSISLSLEHMSRKMDKYN